MDSNKGPSFLGLKGEILLSQLKFGLGSVSVILPAVQKAMWSTRYIDVSAMAELVQKVGLLKLIRTMFETMREDFIDWPSFEKSARIAHHCPYGVVELMPISNSAQFSFKFVNGHPRNPSIGLPTVMAFGTLADMETGFPVLMCEMTILTAVRTAVASALAASVLARTDSKSMAVIGNGAQSEFQILAFYEILGIRQFRLFDIDSAATQKVIRNLKPFTEIECLAFRTYGEAIAGADVVTTATASKSTATILNGPDIVNGVHINAIGGDCPGKTEISPELLSRGRLVVEFEPQSRAEGELQLMPLDFHPTELWEILAGNAAGRVSDDEITIFDSVGFSLEDFSALRTVYELALVNEIGVDLNLIPTMPDVKDVFSLLQL